MYAGRIVELGPARKVLEAPHHPYAGSLRNALPDREFTPIPGQPPLLTDLPHGCSFAPRCDRVAPICTERPPLTDDEHATACHFPC